MPPPPATAAASSSHASVYARLEKTLADPRLETRRKAQQDWLDHVTTILPVSDQPVPDEPLRAALEWIRQTYLRSASEKNRKTGIGLLRELVGHRPAQYKISDDVTRFLVEIHLHQLRDKSEDVRGLVLDILKHIVLNIRSSVTLCFSSILWELVRVIPNITSSERDPQNHRAYSAIVEITRNMLNIIGAKHKPGNQTPFDVGGFISVVRRAFVENAQNPTVVSFIAESCLRPFREMEHVHLICNLHEYLAELLELLNAGQATAAQAASALKDTMPLVTSSFRANLEAAASGLPPQPQADRVRCMQAVLKVMLGRLHANSTASCLQWMGALINHADNEAEIHLLPHIAQMVKCVVPKCSDGIDAPRLNEQLTRLLIKYGSDKEHIAVIAYEEMLTFLRASLDTANTRMTSLNWIAVVHDRNPAVCDGMLDGLNTDVLKCLSDGDEDVVRKALEVLSGMAGADPQRWERFAKALLVIVTECRQQLLGRIPMIVKQLHAQASGAGFPPEFILSTIARLLAAPGLDRHFVAFVVTTLSMMLVTAPELTELRHMLRGTATGDTRSRETFQVLYACWAYNSVWAVALCLLACEYEQAYLIVRHVANSDPNAHTLMQMDRLLQLLETPTFSFLRYALTLPATYPFLVRTMYSILMILPQTSPQFEPLAKRLQCAAQLQSTLSAQAPGEGGLMAHATPPGKGSASSSNGVNGASHQTASDGPLFEVFLAAQRKLADAEVPSQGR